MAYMVGSNRQRARGYTDSAAAEREGKRLKNRGDRGIYIAKVKKWLS